MGFSCAAITLILISPKGDRAIIIMHHTARACTFCAHAPPALKQLWVNTVSQTQTFSNAASILLFKMSIANIIVHVCYQMSSWRRKYWTRTYSNDSVHDTVKLSMIHSIRLGLHDGLWERKRKWLFFRWLKSSSCPPRWTMACCRAFLYFRVQHALVYKMH